MTGATVRALPLETPAARDVGFGTAYERWAVYRLLDGWSGLLSGATALEGPIDGMAGIPGLHLVPLAKRGARVTVAVPTVCAAETVAGVYETLGLRDRLELCVGGGFPPGLFDVVLLYNALPFVDDWEAYLEEAASHARSALVVSLTHPASYGVHARRALRMLQPGDRAPELFDHPSTRASVLEPRLAKLGTVARDAYVDCPWWPDLFVPTGQTLLSGTLGRLPFGARFLRPPASSAPSGAEPFLYGPGRFPFFGGAGWTEELQPALRRHPAFDRAPRPIASLFAHHRIRAVKVRA